MEDKIVFYTTGCSKCRILKEKLDAAEIKYTQVEDVDLMVAKGMMSAPMLEVNDVIMDFANAIRWVSNRKVGV